MDNLLFKSGNSGQVNIDEAQGIVECFVAGIGNKDSVGDVVISGAFAKSLLRRKPRVVWGHSWNDPIGKVLEMYEVPIGDYRLPAKMRNAGIGGLYAKVQFNLNSEKGKEAFATVAFFGEDQEWSIGYKTIDSVFDPNLQANILKEVELYEVSPVLHGANQLTGTISIKGDEKGHMPIIPMPGMGATMMQEMPRIVVIAAPQDGANESSEGDPFAAGMSQELSQPDKMALQAELTERTGSKIEVMNATENTVVFRRTTQDGKASMYRLPYHREGDQYMFGKPEPYTANNPTPQPMQNIEQKPGAPVVVPNGGIAYRNDDQQEMLSMFSNENMVQSPWGKSDVSHLIELPESYMASAKDFISPVLRHHKLAARPNAKGIVIDGLLTANALDALQNAVKALGATLGQTSGNIGQAIGKIRDLAQTFNPYALDGDGDGFVQDGSAFQRPYIPIKKPGFDLPDVRGRKRSGDVLLDKPRSTPKLPKDKNTWTRAQRNEALLAGIVEPETREDVSFLANRRPENEGLAKYWDMSESDLTKEGNRLVNSRRQSTGAEKEKIDEELLKVSHEFQRRASYAETFGQEFVPPAKREVPEAMVPEADKPKPAKPGRTEAEGLASAGKVFDALNTDDLTDGKGYRKWEDLDDDEKLEMFQEVQYDYLYENYGNLGDDGLVEAMEDPRYDDEILEHAEMVYDKIKAKREEDGDMAADSAMDRAREEDGFGSRGEEPDADSLAQRDRERALDEQADAALDRALEGFIDKYGEDEFDKLTAEEQDILLEQGRDQARGLASSGSKLHTNTDVLMEIARRDGWRGGDKQPPVRSYRKAQEALDDWNKLSLEERNSLLDNDEPTIKEFVDALLKARDNRLAGIRSVQAERRNAERKRRAAEEKLKRQFARGDTSGVDTSALADYFPEDEYGNLGRSGREYVDAVLTNWAEMSQADRDKAIRDNRTIVEDPDSVVETLRDALSEYGYKNPKIAQFLDEAEAEADMLEMSGFESRGEGKFGSNPEDSKAAQIFDAILDKYWKMWGFDVPDADDKGWDEPFGFASLGNDEEVKQSKLDELVGGVRERLIAELETADPATWRPSWRNDSLPINPITGKPYRGFNAFWLMMRTSGENYRTGRFAGFNQLKARGAQVRKGEKGVPILRPQLVKKEDEDGNIKEFVVFRGATVFNIDQADGGDEALRAIPADLPESQRIAILDETLKELGVSVRTENITPHYNPDGDYISMPDFSKGTSPLEWTSTLAHEAVHWTGHKSRLDRPSLRDYSSDKKVRAYEELVAEIGSAMLLAAHGIDAPFRQDHAPYIKGWVSLLKDDPDALGNAFKDAQAAVNHMLEKSPNLRKLFGGLDNGKKAPDVDASTEVNVPVGASEGFASLHRVRTPGSEALAGVLYDDNSGELMVGFLKGKSWDDLGDDERIAWIDRVNAGRAEVGGYKRPLNDSEIDDLAREAYEDARDVGWYVYEGVTMEEVQELAAVKSKGRHINALKKLKKARKASDEDQFNFFGRSERVQDVAKTKQTDGFSSRGGNDNMIVERDPRTGYITISAMVTGDRGASEENRGTRRMRVIVAGGSIAEAKRNFRNRMKEDKVSFAGDSDGFASRGPAEPNEGLRRHKLMPVDIRERMPELYSTEDVDTEDKILAVKFFSPYSNWTWYGVEFDGEDTFFGYVEGFEKEWGNFSLSELAGAQLGNGIPAVERDMSFRPTKFEDLNGEGMPTITEDGFASGGSKRIGIEPQYNDPRWIDKTQQRILKQNTDWNSLSHDDQIDWANSFLDEYLRENEMGHGLSDVANGRRLTGRPDIDLLNYAEDAYSKMSDAHMRRRAQFGETDEGFSSVGRRTRRLGTKPSDAVDYVAWDPETESLFVAYKRGDGRSQMYVYEGVNSDEALAVENADSLGKAINAIKRAKNVRQATPEEVMGLADTDKREASETRKRLARLVLEETRDALKGMEVEFLSDTEINVSDGSEKMVRVSLDPDTLEFTVSKIRTIRGGREEPDDEELYDSESALSAGDVRTLTGLFMNDLQKDLDEESRLEREIDDARRELDMAGDAPGVENVDVTYSTALDAVDYNPSTQELRVSYKDGGTYIYEGVDRTAFEEFKSAPSKGRAMNDIKRAHPYRKDSEWTGGVDEDRGIEEFDVRGSEAVEKVTYDPSKEELTVVYSGGKGYVYTAVTREEADAVRSAPSKGRAINDVKRTHDVRKADAPVEERPTGSRGISPDVSKGKSFDERLELLEKLTQEEDDLADRLSGEFDGANPKGDYLTRGDAQGSATATSRKKYGTDAFKLLNDLFSSATPAEREKIREWFDGREKRMSAERAARTSRTIDPAPTAAPKMPTRKPPRGGKRVRNRNVVIEMEQGTLDEIMEAESKNITVDALRDAAGSVNGKYTKGPRKGKNRGSDTITVRDAETGELLHANEILLTSSVMRGSPTAANRKRGYIRARSYAGRQGHNITKDEGPSLRGEGRGMTDYDKRVYGLGSDEKNREYGLASRSSLDRLLTEPTPQEEVESFQRYLDSEYGEYFMDYTQMDDEELKKTLMQRYRMSRSEANATARQIRKDQDTLDELYMAADDAGFDSRGGRELVVPDEYRMYGVTKDALLDELYSEDLDEDEAERIADYWAQSDGLWDKYLDRAISNNEGNVLRAVSDAAQQAYEDYLSASADSLEQRRLDGFASRGQRLGEIRPMETAGNNWIESARLAEPLDIINLEDDDAREKFEEALIEAGVLDRINTSEYMDDVYERILVFAPDTDNGIMEAASGNQARNAPRTRYIVPTKDNKYAIVEFSGDYDGAPDGPPGYYPNYEVVDTAPSIGSAIRNVQKREQNDIGAPTGRAGGRTSEEGFTSSSYESDAEFLTRRAKEREDVLNAPVVKGEKSPLLDMSPYSAFDAFYGGGSKFIRRSEQTYDIYGPVSMPIAQQDSAFHTGFADQIVKDFSRSNLTIDELADRFDITPTQVQEVLLDAKANMLDLERLREKQKKTSLRSTEESDIRAGERVEKIFVGDRKHTDIPELTGEALARREQRLAHRRALAENDAIREKEGAALKELERTTEYRDAESNYSRAQTYNRQHEYWIGKGIELQENIDNLKETDDLSLLTTSALNGEDVLDILKEINEDWDLDFRDPTADWYENDYGTLVDWDGEEVSYDQLEWDDFEVDLESLSIEERQKLIDAVKEKKNWILETAQKNARELGFSEIPNERDLQKAIRDSNAAARKPIEDMRNEVAKKFPKVRVPEEPSKRSSLYGIRNEKGQFLELEELATGWAEEIRVAKAESAAQRAELNAQLNRGDQNLEDGFASRYSRYEGGWDAVAESSEMPNRPERATPMWDDLDEDQQNEFIHEVDYDYMYDNHFGLGDDGIVEAMEDGKYDDAISEHAQMVWDTIAERKEKKRLIDAVTATGVDPEMAGPIADYWFNSDGIHDKYMKRSNGDLGKAMEVAYEDYLSALADMQEDGFASRGSATKPSVDAETQKIIEGASLGQLAEMIQDDLADQGKEMYFGAVPYIDALSTMDSMDDRYGADSAQSVVAYALSNLQTYKGAKARAIKAELKKRLDEKVNRDGFASRSSGTDWGPLAGEVAPARPLRIETEWLNFEDLDPEEQDQLIRDGIENIDRVAQPDIDLEAERDFIIEEYDREARAARSDAAESLLKEIYELWDQDADADNIFQKNGNLAYAEELVKNGDYVEDYELAEARNIVDEVRERWEERKKNSVDDEPSDIDDEDSDGFASRMPNDGERLMRRGNRDFLSDEFSPREYRQAMSGLDKVRNNTGSPVTTEENAAIRKLADLYRARPKTTRNERDAINDVVNSLNSYRSRRSGNEGFASRGGRTEQIDVRNSSAVEQVTYDPLKEELLVVYSGNRGYIYEGVTRGEADALIDAPSKGGAINGIKATHSFRKASDSDVMDFDIDPVAVRKAEVDANWERLPSSDKEQYLRRATNAGIADGTGESADELLSAAKLRAMDDRELAMLEREAIGRGESSSRRIDVSSSSALNYVDYDEKTRTLSVEFRGRDGNGNGTLYNYQGVEPDVVDELENSDSRGATMRRIRDNYEFTTSERLPQSAYEGLSSRSETDRLAAWKPVNQDLRSLRDRVKGNEINDGLIGIGDAEVRPGSDFYRARRRAYMGLMDELEEIIANAKEEGNLDLVGPTEKSRGRFERLINAGDWAQARFHMIGEIASVRESRASAENGFASRGGRKSTEEYKKIVDSLPDPTERPNKNRYMQAADGARNVVEDRYALIHARRRIAKEMAEANGVEWKDGVDIFDVTNGDDDDLEILMDLDNRIEELNKYVTANDKEYRRVRNMEQLVLQKDSELSDIKDGIDLALEEYEITEQDIREYSGENAKEWFTTTPEENTNELAKSLRGRLLDLNNHEDENDNTSLSREYSEDITKVIKLIRNGTPEDLREAAETMQEIIGKQRSDYQDRYKSYEYEGDELIDSGYRSVPFFDEESDLDLDGEDDWDYSQEIDEEDGRLNVIADELYGPEPKDKETVDEYMSMSTEDGFASGGRRRPGRRNQGGNGQRMAPTTRYSDEDRQNLADRNILRSRKRPAKRRQPPDQSEWEGFASTNLIDDDVNDMATDPRGAFEGGEHGPGKDISLRKMWENIRRSGENNEWFSESMRAEDLARDLNIPRNVAQALLDARPQSGRPEMFIDNPYLADTLSQRIGMSRTRLFGFDPLKYYDDEGNPASTPEEIDAAIESERARRAARLAAREGRRTGKGDLYRGESSNVDVRDLESKLNIKLTDDNGDLLKPTALERAARDTGLGWSLEKWRRIHSRGGALTPQDIEKLVERGILGKEAMPERGDLSFGEVFQWPGFADLGSSRIIDALSETLGLSRDEIMKQRRTIQQALALANKGQRKTISTRNLQQGKLKLTRAKIAELAERLGLDASEFDRWFSGE